jgi:putative transcriptional regulator
LSTTEAPDFPAVPREPHLGQFVRGWRSRAGLTQEGLAHALSVTFSTVSRWENGHVRPSKLAWKAIERLARERGVALDVAAA